MFLGEIGPSTEWSLVAHAFRWAGAHCLLLCPPKAIQLMCCRTTPWFKPNCRRWRWLGYLLQNSQSKDNPYIDVPGSGTYWLGEHSCDGWCHAALQPPNHTVWNPALKRRKKCNFCYSQNPRKHFPMYILGALLDQVSCQLPKAHTHTRSRYLVINSLDPF